MSNKEKYLAALERIHNSEFEFMCHALNDFYYTESGYFLRMHYPEFVLMSPSERFIDSGDQWLLGGIENKEIRETILCFCIAMCD